jgi:hypothetical protein
MFHGDCTFPGKRRFCGIRRAERERRRKNVRTNTYYLMQAKSKKMRQGAVFADFAFSTHFRPDRANVQPLREEAVTKSYKKKLLFCYQAFSWKISDLRAKTSPAS